MIKGTAVSSPHAAGSRAGLKGRVPRSLLGQCLGNPSLGSAHPQGPICSCPTWAAHLLSDGWERCQESRGADTHFGGMRGREQGGPYGPAVALLLSLTSAWPPAFGSSQGGEVCSKWRPVLSPPGRPGQAPSSPSRARWDLKSLPSSSVLSPTQL